MTFITIESNIINFIIIIKIYTYNGHFITTKCDIANIVMKNRTLPSVYNALSRVFITFNWEQILMLVENYHHLQTFSVVYLWRQYFSIVQKNFITYLLKLISIKDITKYKRTSINSFNTHFLSLITIGSKLLFMSTIIVSSIKYFFYFYRSEKRTYLNVALVH